MPTTVTLAPTSTAQAGSGATILGGSGSVHAALADSSDTTYVRVSGRRRLDTEVTRVGFTMPAFPAGAQVVSVALLRRARTVTSGTSKPRCWHALRCLGEVPVLVGGAAQTAGRPVVKDPVVLEIATSAVATWVDETVYATPMGPDGKPWTTSSDGNLATVAVELGREDTAASTMDYAKLSLAVTYQEQATVTLTAPTGTVTDTCRPTITGTYASTDSQQQVRIRFAVYSNAQKTAPGFAPFTTTPTAGSGWLVGDVTSWIPDTDLVNGVWWAYAQAASKFDGPTEFLTTIGSTSWTQSMVGAPNAVLNFAAHSASGNYVRITATPGAGSTTHALAFQVSRDQGYTWGPVRGGLMKLASGSTPLVVDDHEFELNRPSRYRVLAYGKSGAVLVPAADYSASIDVTARARAWWLTDVLNPLDKLEFPVLDASDSVTYESVMGVFKPVTGATSGVAQPKFVVRGPTYTPDGDLTLFFSAEDLAAEAKWATYRRMVASGRALLLQNPAAQDPTSQNLYVHLSGRSSGGEPETVTYAAPGGRKVRYRRVPVGYVSTSAPDITS